MKKALLLLSLGCISGVMTAEMVAPKVFDLVSFQKISPDGRYVASEMYGSVQIFDLVANTSYDYFDETGMTPYGVGIGNSFGAGNILVGYAGGDEKAAYWQNGKWTLLPLGESDSHSNMANGISGDGSRICGTVCVIEMTLDDATMSVPALWQRNDDGEYETYTILPHPTVDFTGRAPQYVTALAISADGKTIAGTMTDCAGRLVTPVIYTQNDKGEWSYTLPMEKYINPNKIELPEDPGDYPQMPAAADYMSQEEIDAYNAAYDAWAAGGYEGDMPEYADYMSDENKALYNAAYSAWQAEAKVFEEKQEKYFEALNEIYESSVGIIYNNILLNPEGTQIAVTVVTEVPDPNGWFPGATKEINHVWILPLDGSEPVKYEDAECTAHTWNSDGSISGWGSIWAENPAAYILKDGNATSFRSYLTNIDSELTEWVNTNMKHVVETYDWDTEEVIQTEDYYVGLPLFSEDMKTLVSWTPTPWDYDIMYQGYVFDLSQFNGMHSAVVNDELKVYVDHAGTVIVDGTAVSVQVYNLQGVCVATANNISGATGITLETGAYIIKAVSENGTTSVAKVVK